MAEETPAKWELLKKEGNDLFARGQNALAFAKYSEAIALAPKNAMLYSNRAATLIKMGKLDSAKTDATRAVDLDPSWGKAYVRLGEVFVAMHRHREAIEAYDKAIPLSDSKQQQQSRTQQKRIQNLFEDRSQPQLSVLSEDKLVDNWFIKLMERDIPNPKNYNNTAPCPLGYLTAADKIYTAHLEWNEGLETLSKLRREGEMVYAGGKVTEPFFAALARDERCFYMINACGSLGEDEMAEKERLREEGWNSVRPAMAVTVRANFVLGVMNLGLGQFGEACHQMRQSIAIAEEIIREFPLSRTLDHETRGSTFRPTLIRSMLIIRGNALIRSRASTKSPSAFPLEEIKTLADKILDSLKQDPILLPPPVMPPFLNDDMLFSFKFHFHFGQYHYASAYMLLGYYYNFKAIDEGVDYGSLGREANRQHLETSCMYYTRAAALYPNDEIQKQAALWAVIDNTVRAGGATVGQLRSMMDLTKKLSKVTAKYNLGDTKPPYSDVVYIVERLEKLNGPEASKLVLRPMRTIKIDPAEDEETFTNRMLSKDVRSDDDDGTNWVKVYSKYVSLRESGSNLMDGCDLD